MSGAQDGHPDPDHLDLKNALENKMWDQRNSFLGGLDLPLQAAELVVRLALSHAEG